MGCSCTPLAWEIYAYILSLVCLSAVFSFIQLGNLSAWIGWVCAFLPALGWAIHLTLNRRERNASFTSRTSITLPTSVDQSFVPHPDLTSYRESSPDSLAPAYISLNPSNSFTVPMRYHTIPMAVAYFYLLSMAVCVIYELIRSIQLNSALNAQSKWMAFIAFAMALKHSFILVAALRKGWKMIRNGVFR